MKGKTYHVYAPAEDSGYMLACGACGIIEELGFKRTQAYRYAAEHDCRSVACCLECGLVNYTDDGCNYCVEAN